MRTKNPDPALIVETADGMFDLTTADGSITSMMDLLRRGQSEAEGYDEVARRVSAAADEIDPEDVLSNLTVPCMPEEVWAAGVTYEISEQAREEESAMPDIYMDVYRSDRPEIFFKATPSRTVGPGESIGVRTDSEWDVPEPELGVVLHHGEVIGYTIGNDVSSRSIEGENPLYLPQAKVYNRSCAIGPAVVSADGVDPTDMEISMQIRRGADVMFDGTTSTSNLKRSLEELVEHCLRSDAVPEMMVLLTGTSLVPGDGFTLLPEDEVSIHIDEIGTLHNHVVSV